MYLPNTSYCAGIMLDAFRYLLCSKLCWHNWPVPNDRDTETPVCTYHPCQVLNMHMSSDVISMSQHKKFGNFIYHITI